MKIKKLKTGKTIDNAEWLVFDSYDKMYEFIYKNLNGRFLKSQMLNKDWLDEICSYLSMNCIRADGKITTRIFKYRKQFLIDISICEYEIVPLREYLKEEYLGDHIFFKKRKTRYKG